MEERVALLGRGAGSPGRRGGWRGGTGARGLLAASVGLLPRRFATHQMGWVVTEIGILFIALHFVRCTGDIIYVYNIFTVQAEVHTCVAMCMHFSLHVREYLHCPHLV